MKIKILSLILILSVTVNLFSMEEEEIPLKIVFHEQCSDCGEKFTQFLNTTTTHSNPSKPFIKMYKQLIKKVPNLKLDFKTSQFYKGKYRIQASVQAPCMNVAVCKLLKRFSK